MQLFLLRTQHIFVEQIAIPNTPTDGKQEIGQTSTCLPLIATKVACEIKLLKTLFIVLCFVTNFALRKVQTVYTLSCNIMTLVDVHSVFSVCFTKCNFLVSLE